MAVEISGCPNSGLQRCSNMFGSSVKTKREKIVIYCNRHRYRFFSWVSGTKQLTMSLLYRMTFCLNKLESLSLKDALCQVK